MLPITAPAALIAAILGYLLLTDASPRFGREPWQDVYADFSGGPNGRILHLIVEPEGVYLGNDCIPASQLATQLRAQRATLAPDYVIVSGTEDARYGDFVVAFAAARAAFPKIGATVETRLLPPGTRRPRIESSRYWGAI